MKLLKMEVSLDNETEQLIGQSKPVEKLVNVAQEEEKEEIEDSKGEDVE
jgi:hypothetical protein